MLSKSLHLETHALIRLLYYICHEQIGLYSIINISYKLFTYKSIYECESIDIGLSSNCSIGICLFLGIGATLLISSGANFLFVTTATATAVVRHPKTATAVLGKFYNSTHNSNRDCENMATQSITSYASIKCFMNPNDKTSSFRDSGAQVAIKIDMIVIE